MNVFFSGVAPGQTWIEIVPDKERKPKYPGLVERRKTRYFSLVDDSNQPLVSLRVASDFSSAWQGRLMVVAFGYRNPNPFIDYHAAIEALGSRLGISITPEAYPYWDSSIPVPYVHSPEVLTGSSIEPSPAMP